MALALPGGLNAICGYRCFLRPGFPDGLHHERRRTRPQSIRAVSAPPAQQTLQYKKLGDSDLVISEITLGTMTWGNQNTMKEGQEQLAYAFDHGINILDTAEAYPSPFRKETQGNTDRTIAGWLKTMPRDKVIVASKVTGFSETFTHVRDSGETVRVNRKQIMECMEKSLKRLETDYIDLLQIHWPDRYVPTFGRYMFDFDQTRLSVPFEEQLGAFQDLIQQGKLRYIGVSNETAFGVSSFIQAAKTFGLPKIVSIQNNYNLLYRLPAEVNLVEACSPMYGNVGFLAYSPLAGGALSGKYIDLESDAAKRGRFYLLKGYMMRYNTPASREAVVAYAEVAKRYNLSLTQLALAFCRDRPFMTSTIIGATTMDQLKENISAFQLPRPLSQEILDEIEAVFKKYRDPTLV
ncbi:unnamed protein product [Calypogeia fissa]